MTWEGVYQLLPVALQNMGCSIEGWRIARRRYGFGYADIAQSVKGRCDDPSDIDRYRASRAKLHMVSAYQSQFWARRFRQWGVHPDGNDPFRELEKLPILQKSEVQKHSAELSNPLIISGMVDCHTSGTTGAGLRFRETFAAEQERWAVWWRYRQWHGISQDMWCGYFGGRSVVPLRQSKPPYWRMNYPGRQILFSGYHLSPSTAAEYLAALETYSPPWLHGYPSLLSLLASYLLERGKPLKNPPSIVTTGAENLLPQQRDLMVKAFGCPVRQHYGQAESVANISECPNGHLHIDEDFSFVELIPLDSCPDTFRVIGTNWSNPAFPLLRYDTGDLVRCLEEVSSCSMTGRMVDSIDGRKEDYVVLPNGARLGRLDHIFKDLTRIREAQIYQPERDMIIFKIVKGDGYGPEVEQRLLNEARKRLGREMAIKVEYVSFLKRSRTGKLRFVVSEVS